MLNLSLGICIIILLFLVPGALFRKAFNSVNLSDYHRRASTFSEIVLTIALSFFIQVLGLLFLELLDIFCSNMPRVDSQVVADIISYKSDTNFKPIQDNFLKIVLYQLCIYTLCVLAGRLFLRIIINNKLDKRVPFLRFDNEWHYILSGRILNPNKEVVKYANVLVDMEDYYIIYTGFLADYSLDKEGKLGIIELESVKRKVITKSDSKMDKTQEYFFNVNSLFIPYDKILNFSITYFNLDEVNEAAPPTRKEKFKAFFNKFFFNKNMIIFLLSLIIFIFAFRDCNGTPESIKKTETQTVKKK